ncbi:unnamed protein product [Closterium sp. Naga37s-1]|nr:unnamed protein product [Closterium sp. Naga37s-1]
MQCILTEPLAFNRSLLKPDDRPFGTRQHERFLLTSQLRVGHIVRITNSDVGPISAQDFCSQVPEEFHDDATRILTELIKAIKRPWWTALRTPHVSCASSGDWFMLSDDHYSISHLALRVIAYIPPSSVSANVHLVSPDHHITRTPANTGLFRLQDLIEVHVRDWWLAGPLHTGAGLGARIDLLQDGVPSLADIRRLLYSAQPLTHHSRWTRDLTLPPPPLPGLKDPFLKDQPSRQRDILFRLYTLTLPSRSRFQYFDDRGVCPRCPAAVVETLPHIFFECSSAGNVISALRRVADLRPSQTTPAEHIFFPIQSRVGQSPPWNLLVGAAVKTLWNSRCDHRYRNSSSSSFEILQLILAHQVHCALATRLPTKLASALHHALVVRPPVPPRTFFAAKSPPRLPISTSQPQHRLAAAIRRRLIATHRGPSHSLTMHYPSLPFAPIPLQSLLFPSLPFLTSSSHIPSPLLPSLLLPSLHFPSPLLSSLLLPSLQFPSPLLPSLSFPCFALPALPFPSPPFPFLPIFYPPCTSLPLSSLPFPSLVLPSLHYPSPLLPSLSFPSFALPALPFPSPFFPFLPIFYPPCTSLPLSSLPFPSLVLPSLHFPSPLLPSLSFPSFALPALPFPSPFFPFLRLFAIPALPFLSPPFPSPFIPFPFSSLPHLFPFPSLPFPSIRVSSPPCPIVFLPTSPFFSLPPLFSPCLPFFLHASPFFSLPPLFSPWLPLFLHASPFFSMPPLSSPCLPFFLHASPFFSLDHHVSMPCHLL